MDWNFMNWGKKDKITVELLESRISAKENEMDELKTMMKDQHDLYESVQNTSITSYQRQSLWDAVFRKSASRKADLVKAANSIKGSFLHSGIIELLVGDALAPSSTTNNILDLFASGNKKIEKELKEFQETINIDAIAGTIIEDVITYGEYYLGVQVEQGKGVVKVTDDVDQANVVSVYDGTEPSKYLRFANTRHSKKVEELNPDQLVHFCLGSRKLRIRVEGIPGVKKMSEYVRVGIPFFYGVFDLVNTLTLLTGLVPASYLQKINGTSVIGVQISEGTDPDKAFKVCRRYENLLNKASSYDPTKGEMNVTDLISAAGKWKCIPLMGEKGRMDKIDPRHEELTDISMFQEFKKDIFGTVGVPYNFFYGGITSKGDSLKQFARYTKKLAMIQKAISTGFIQLAKIHLKAKGMDGGNLIETKFANALISVEELDKIEFESTLMTVLGEMVSVVSDIAQNGEGKVNGKVLNSFINERLRMLNLTDVIDFPSEVKPDAPKEKLKTSVKVDTGTGEIVD